MTSTPVAVPGLGTVVDVQAGYAHACALEETGDVYCWGARCGAGYAASAEQNQRGEPC